MSEHQPGPPQKPYDTNIEARIKRIRGEVVGNISSNQEDAEEKQQKHLLSRRRFGQLAGLLTAGTAVGLVVDRISRSGFGGIPTGEREGVDQSFAVDFEYSPEWSPEDPLLQYRNEDLDSDGIVPEGEKPDFYGYDQATLSEIYGVVNPKQRPIYWGGTPGNEHWEITQVDIDTLTEIFGKKPSMLNFYTDMWKENPSSYGFQREYMELLDKNGIIPYVTLMPGDTQFWGKPDQQGFKDFALQTFVEGKHDDFFIEYAQKAAAWGKPFFLRMFHEVNGDSWWPYPWVTQERNGHRVNGNTPEQFVQAWRRIVDIFRTHGANNITTVFNPDSADHTEEPTLRALYPGDEYVDSVAFDGYMGVPNFADAFDRFRTIYNNMLKVAPNKPMGIAEMGVKGSEEQQAMWVEQMFGKLLPYVAPQIQYALYFHKDKTELEGHNWQLSGRGASMARRLIASSYYLDNKRAPKAESGKVPIARTALQAVGAL